MKLSKILALAIALLQAAPALAQSGSGGGGLGWNNGGQSAASDLPYITISNQSGLSQERALAAAGTFPELVITDNGANSTVTLGWSGQLPIDRGGTGGATAQAAANAILGAASGSTGDIYYRNGAGNIVRLPIGGEGELMQVASGIPAWGSATGSSSLQYLVLALDAGLSAERRFVAGTGLSATDGGANGNYTLAIDSTVTTLTGSQTLTNKTLTTPTLTSPTVGTSLIFDNGSNDVTIAWSSTAPRTHTIPDVADANFIMSQGAQTKAGVLTLSSSPVLSTATITASGDTYTIPDVGNADFIMSAGAQTKAGVLTLSSQPVLPSTGFKVDQSSGDYTISFNNPAADRTYTVVDIGGAGNFLMSSGSLTAGSVAYFDGNKAVSTGAGTTGQYLKSQGSSAPIWASIATFGGDGSDGAITIAGSTTYSGPIQKNATTFTVNSSQTLTCDTGPVIINASGAVTINGSISCTASGGTGGAALSSGDQSGWNGGGPGGGSSFQTDTNACGGGGGAGARGGKGGRGGNGNASTGRGAPGGSPSFSLLDGGGGGGSGSGNSASTGADGGRGGSFFAIYAVGALTLSSTGSITASGANGTNGGGTTTGGGAGGGGGAVVLASQTSVTCQASSVVTASGGTGGNGTSGFTGGGAGGGGGSRTAWSPSNTLSGTTTLSGGSGGSTGGSGQAGESGSSGVAYSVTGTPNMPILAQYVSPEGQEFVGLLADLHRAAGKTGEVEISQRTLARHFAGGDLNLYAKYMSPDWEGTSTVCDAVDLGGAG